jgi:hypothetical protein
VHCTVLAQLFAVLSRGEGDILCAEHNPRECKQLHRQHYSQLPCSELLLELRNLPCAVHRAAAACIAYSCSDMRRALLLFSTFIIGMRFYSLQSTVAATRAITKSTKARASSPIVGI